MDYNFKPLGTSRRFYYINPEHLINLKDLILLLKYESTYKIAQLIKSDTVRLYYHQRNITKDTIIKMVCYPVFLLPLVSMEYKLLHHRLYFLKRELNDFFSQNKLIGLEDKILESPDERIATINNLDALSKQTINRIFIELSDDHFSFINSIVTISASLPIFATIFLRFCMAFFKDEKYLCGNLEYYDGKSLKVSSDTLAKRMINKFLIKHNCTKEVLIKNTKLRNEVALELYNIGINPLEIGAILRSPTAKKTSNENVKRIVYNWIAEAKKELSMSVEKSL